MIHKLDINYPGGFVQFSKDISYSRYGIQALFHDAIYLKLNKDAQVDDKGGRINLADHLYNSSSITNIIKDRYMKLSAIGADALCKRDYITTFDGTISFESVVEELCNLRYDKLVDFFECLTREVLGVHDIVAMAQYVKETKHLEEIVGYLYTVKDEIAEAWRISEPKMKPDGSC